MISNKPNIKNIILIFAPLIACMLIQFFVSFADTVFLLTKNTLENKVLSGSESASFSLNEAYKSPTNLAWLTMAQYIFYIIVFGLWYYLFIQNSKNYTDSHSILSVVINNIKNGLNTIKPRYLFLCLIIAGYTGQLFTDAALNILRNIFPKLFTHYDKLIDDMAGNAAMLPMLISVYLLAPIGEELLFRGVILSYSKKEFNIILSALLNGILFGLYHGNIIQSTYAFLFGVILASVALKFGSIIPGIILHLAINCSTLLMADSFFNTRANCTISLFIALSIFTIMLAIIFRHKNNTNPSNS